MGLLDGIEKLINEHGSATILKERIALANDKYVALEQKLAASELRTKELESENQRLNVDLEKATVEIQNLKKLIDEFHSNPLDDVKEKILVLLSKHEELEAEQIAHSLNIGSQLAAFHLEELKNSRMVRDYYAVGSPVFWALDQPGREHLVKRCLLA